MYRVPKDVLQLLLHSLLDRGMHNLVEDAIGRCQAEVQRELWSNVVLAGGSTLFRGFDTRLLSELRVTSKYPVKVIAPPERKVSF
jgi:centractin